VFSVLDKATGTTVSTTSCGLNGSITISTSSPVIANDTATIGFWHNGNGQAVILSFNGSASSTTLGNWLAATFPYLYGPSSKNNLMGATNTKVAALFMTFFGEKGQKTDAQILGAALACYATSSTVNGSALPSKYGFNISATGTGTKLFNVGIDGTGIGLLSNTFYTVLELLQRVSATIQNGTYASDVNSFSDIFSNINQTGDII